MVNADRSTTVQPGRLQTVVSAGPDDIRLAITRDGRILLSGIRLGVVIDGVDLGSGSVVIREASRAVDETWRARSGKARGVQVVAHTETTLAMRHESGREWQVRVRAAADGVAVRYAIEGLQGLAHLEGDQTSVPLDAASRAWVLDYQTWYETPRRGVDIGDLDPGRYGLPFLMRLADGDHLLVTESAIDGRFSGSHALVGDGMLRFATADDRVEIARGDITPWRVFIIGSIERVVESRFVDELAPPVSPAMADADWVRPGRAAWSWWSDFYSGSQLHRQQHFVDVAAELGWEHLLIDCGWEQTWVPEIVAYASRRGIQVHLWTVWHDLDGPEKLARLELWRSWGVAGIKVDFMESESKDRYRWYDAVLAETARVGLMVNFHGSVIPRGWARTWPQVIGYEAIRGSEYYVFYNDTPLTAAHNVIQPFTRNVVGGMDYTPVAFTAPGRTTSDAHELALSVAFECGITHFADDVDTYLARPLAARFLSELAPSWDETVLLSGTPDTEAVVARRSGDRWFIGAIATGEARTVTVPLDRLIAEGQDALDAWIVSDGDAGLYAQRNDGIRELDVDLAAGGGFVAIAAPAGAELFRSVPRPTGSVPLVEPALIELDADGSAELTVSPTARLRLPPGWLAEPRGKGRWLVHAAPDLAAGALGIVTVEEPGDDGVARVAHARLVAALNGEHTLSRLPMLAFRNESGPVERDMSNGGGNPADGGRLRIAGAEYDDGFGTSTPSSLDLHLGGRAERLTGLAGVDDETPGTRARVRVLADGAELFSAEIAAGAPPVAIDVDLTGARILTLTSEPIEPGDQPAHVDWAAGRITAPPADLHTTPHPGR